MNVYIKFACAPYMTPGMYQRAQLVGVFCCTVPSFSLCCGADDHPVVELENKHKVYWWVMRFGYIHIVLDILMCAWWINESRFCFNISMQKKHSSIWLGIMTPTFANIHHDFDLIFRRTWAWKIVATIVSSVVPWYCMTKRFHLPPVAFGVW